MAELPADAHIDSVDLAVSDLGRSAAFYVETLGFREHDRSATHAVLGSGPRPLIALHLQPHAVPRPRRTAGLFHVAILVPTRAALGRSLRRLAARAWPLSGAADHWVSEALYLDDPDGLGLEIYRDRPRDQWPREGDRLLMSTEALDLDAIANEPGADTRWDGLDPATVIGHVHLQVSSLASAEALYCDDIGFTPMVRAFRGALFVAAGGYHHHLGLNTWAGEGVPPPPSSAAGLRGFTIAGRTVEPRDVHDPATGVVIRLRGRGPAEAGA
jgi:catechol 2,3-dioxygenase